MKSRAPHSLLLKTGSFVLLSLLTVGNLPADTIKLKDGRTLEGTIDESLSTAETLHFIEKKGNIKDPQNHKRTDIVTIKKLTPDEVEFNSWGDLKSTKDQMNPTDYDGVLKQKLLPFGEKHKSSPLLPKVNELVKQYTEEMAKVNSGAMKLDGRWIEPEEMRWNSYVIEGRILEKQMEELMKQSNASILERHLLAEIFDKRTKLKQGYAGTPSYIAGEKLYKAFLDNMKATLELDIKLQPAKLAERDRGWEGLAQDQLAVAKAAVEAGVKKRKEENDRLNKALKIPLKTYDPLEPKGMAEALKDLEKERLAIAAQSKDWATLEEGAKAIAKAIEEGHKGNAPLAWTLMEQGMKNLKSFAGDAKLRAMMANMKKASDEALKAPATDSTLKPAGTPGAEAPKPGGTLAPRSSLTEKKEDKAATTPGNTPVKKLTLEEEEDSGNSMLLIMGVAVLAVVGVLAMVFGKKKKKKSDDDEE